MRNKKIIIKREKGITLIALVVTIIVLLILAGVSLTGGLQTATNSRDTAVLSELEMIQHAALERYTKGATVGNYNNFPGTQKYTDISQIKSEIPQLTSDTTLMQILENTKDSVDDYYYLDADDLKELEITGADDSYIINYKIGLVIDVTNQMTKQGEPVYTYAKDGSEE